MTVSGLGGVGQSKGGGWVCLSGLNRGRISGGGPHAQIREPREPGCYVIRLLCDLGCCTTGEPGGHVIWLLCEPGCHVIRLLCDPGCYATGEPGGDPGAAACSGGRGASLPHGDRRVGRPRVQGLLREVPVLPQTGEARVCVCVFSLSLTHSLTHSFTE